MQSCALPTFASMTDPGLAGECGSYYRDLFSAVHKWPIMQSFKTVVQKQKQIRDQFIGKGKGKENQSRLEIREEVKIEFGGARAKPGLASGPSPRTPIYNSHFGYLSILSRPVQSLQTCNFTGLQGPVLREEVVLAAGSASAID